MESSRRGSVTDRDFGFAFNGINSDRILRIEITGGQSSSLEDGDSGCAAASSIADSVRDRKRRTQEAKKDNNDVLDLAVSPEEQDLKGTQPELDDILVHENEDQGAVAMIEEPPSGDEDGGNESNLRIKELHISSPVLAAKSSFFYKLFSSGMRESKETRVTLRIDASEEAALVELLNFMYRDSLSVTEAPDLLNVLVAADKFEVDSCMKHCSHLLRNMPMTLDSALLYLELPSSILMPEAVRPLTNAAKYFLASHYKDITNFQEEVMSLPLAGIEAIFSSDDLQIASEDAVYEFLLKWARTQHPVLEERREILSSRLARYIRFPYMTCRELKKFLTSNDFDNGFASKLVLEALFFKAEAPHRQRILAAEESASLNHRLVERAYKYRPVKVVEFERPRPQCIVYLDLKREDCASLFPSGTVYSQAFHLGGQRFFLSAHCNMEQQGAFHFFGLFLGMQEKGSVSLDVDYEFAARSKPTEDFMTKCKRNSTFTGGKAVGYRNLFRIPWTSFMAEDSLYFINDVLHLRAQLTIRSTN